MTDLPSPRRWRVVHVVLLVALVAGAVTLAMWSWFSGPNIGKYAPVIQQLAANQLNAVDGRIDLKSSFPGLTPRDEIFLTRRPDGSFLAMFPTYYGKGISIGGLLYTSRPLQPSDTLVRSQATSLNRRSIDVGRWDKLWIDKRISDQWYRVSRGVR